MSLGFQLQIYFGTFEVTTFEEEPHWTSETIMMGIGGALSLWLGITLAGILEFFELICRLVLAIFSWSPKSKRYKSKQINQIEKLSICIILPR